MFSKSKKDKDCFPEEESKDPSPPPPAYSVGGSKLSQTLSRIASRTDKKRDADTAAEASSAPPPIDSTTKLPTTFRIGKHYVAPLVTVPELVDHLRFLGCLHKLQADVRALPTFDASPDQQVPEEVKWAAFCTRAGTRFQDWAMSPQVMAINAAPNGKPSVQDVENALAGVDIDVLMAWHTYMLNPSAYREDMVRMGSNKLRGLAILGAFPLRLIALRIDDSLMYIPVREPSHVPLHSLDTLVTFLCPKCDTINNVPLLGPPGVGGGYATPDMAAPCVSCGLTLTHNVLRCGKLINDLGDVLFQRNTFLAGLGYNETPSFTQAAGEEMSSALMRAATNKYGLLKDVGNHNQWNLSAMRAGILNRVAAEALFRDVARKQTLGNLTTTGYRGAIGAAVARMNRVYNAGSGLVFSVDLGPAIMRQAGFISNMHALGWLDHARWSNEQDEGRFYFLQKSAARYHAFLDLMNANPHAFLSPTLDIDLAWHSHQLHGRLYELDTTRFVGKFINHDDAIADTHLKSAYDRAAELWAKRFHANYSGCGCPVPKDAAKALASAKRRASGSLFSLGGRDKNAQSIAGTLQEITAMTDDDASVANRAAECPSTHNRMHIVGSRKADKLYAATLERPFANPNHPDPFRADFAFSRDATDQRRRRPDAAAGMGGMDGYWGVAPYTASGPWGLRNPWAMAVGAGAIGIGVGVGVGVGMGAGGGAACGGGSDAPCCTGGNRAGGGAGCGGAGGMCGDGGGAHAITACATAGGCGGGGGGGGGGCGGGGGGGGGGCGGGGS